MLEAKRSAPRLPGGALISLANARSARFITSRTLRSVCGSGSYTATSMPFCTSRAAQPAPITPPPTIAAFRIATVIGARERCRRQPSPLVGEGALRLRRRTDEGLLAPPSDSPHPPVREAERHPLPHT